MKTRSLKQGTTAAARARLNAATVANTNPPVGGTTVPHAAFGPLAQCDLMFEETAGGTCDLEVFYFYEASGTYLRDDVIGTVPVTASTTGGIVLNPSAADGIYVALSNFAAGASVNVHGQAKYA